MAKPVVRKPQPIVFVFQLGDHAKVGKKSVPTAYAAAPCYVHRESEGARTKHLDALAETPIGEPDAETLFAAIELLIDRCDLRRELSTDLEIDAGKSAAYTTGFHPGATIEQVSEALARGGFSVVRLDDPHAVPPVKRSKDEELARTLADLARNIDHTSLAGLVGSTRTREELGFHASGAEGIVASAFEEKDTTALLAGIRAFAAGAAPGAANILVLLVARVAREAKAPTAQAVRTFLASLPGPSDTRVQNMLGEWKLEGGPVAPPATRPR